MKVFTADLHIHTVLSPCGSLRMSPVVIVQTAKERKLDIIGITDHNSTLQCRTVSREAARAGITTYCGVEVNTKEEVHCLAFFEDFEKLDAFQQYLDKYLPERQNDARLFGYQVVVNETDEITYEETRLLISGIEQNIGQVEKQVHSLDGIFIPAHVNRQKYSLTSQLGFIPPDLNFDALELSEHTRTAEFLRVYSCPGNPVILRNSDAHEPTTIGKQFNRLIMKDTGFGEFRKAIRRMEGREVLAQ